MALDVHDPILPPLMPKPVEWPVGFTIVFAKYPIILPRIVSNNTPIQFCVASCWSPLPLRVCLFCVVFLQDFYDETSTIKFPVSNKNSLQRDFSNKKLQATCNATFMGPLSFSLYCTIARFYIFFRFYMFLKEIKYIV